MDFDYKKYSLDKLNEWMHDALSCSEATPQEIYDVIKKVVEENYYNYKYHTGRCYELLALLNGNGKGHISIGNYATDPKGNQVKVCSKDDPSPECQGAWNDFWEEHYYPEEYQEDKVVKWQLPIEVDGLTGDCYVNFPDDLLEAANLKEGDQVEWIDRGDGSYLLKKVNTTPSWVEGNELRKTKTYDEMIADGWSMTDDGFWIKE
jgi:antitoxin component of MazEF toxin-antitoxin module